MSNIIRKTVDLAKLISDCYVDKDSIVVDATCGNGNDTLYYAKKCRFVYGFDIQRQAIDSTEQLLKDAEVSNYKLICCSHEYLKDYVKESIDLCIFNLGYLPNADKSITTNSASTLKAIKGALDLLKMDGAICIVMYYGHEAGKKERGDVLAFVKELDSSCYHTGYFSSPNQKNCPPEIILISRKK